MRRQTMVSYDAAAAVLGDRAQKTLGYATRLIRRGPQAIAVRYHNTDVVTYQADGTIVLRDGGWRTVTTKQRFNDYTPWRVYSQKNIWYVWDSRSERQVPYYDGIALSGDPAAWPVDDPQAARLWGARRVMARRIERYLDEVLAYYHSGRSLWPQPGDCWYCGLRTEQGLPLGEAAHNVDHLLSHLEEGYVVPSLICNAFAEQGARNTPLAMLLRLNLTEDGCLGPRGAGRLEDLELKRVVRNYLKRRLLRDDVLLAEPEGVAA